MRIDAKYCWASEFCFVFFNLMCRFREANFLCLNISYQSMAILLFLKRTYDFPVRNIMTTKNNPKSPYWEIVSQCILHALITSLISHFWGTIGITLNTPLIYLYAFVFVLYCHCHYISVGNPSIIYYNC